MPTKAKPPQVRGWITPLIARITYLAVWPTRQLILGERAPKDHRRDPTKVAARARNVDTFIAIMFALEVISYLGAGWAYKNRQITWQVTSCVIPVFAILGITANAAQLGLFDRFKATRDHQPFVASHERIIVLGFINLVELSICFGAIYAANTGLIGGRRDLDWLDPLHLSAISQFTVGYGDIYPTKWLRIVTWLQSMSTLCLIVLIIGRFVALPTVEASIDEELRGLGRDEDSNEEASSEV